MKKRITQGFTLIELLVVIGIIGILAAIVLIAVNPGRNFAQARDAQRRSDLLQITNAIYQFAAEHDGDLPDTDGVDTTSNFPTQAAPQEIGTAAFDLGAATNAAGADVIVPDYIAAIPTDPATGDDGNTGYWIYADTNGRLVATAASELNPGTTITIER